MVWFRQVLLGLYRVLFYSGLTWFIQGSVLFMVRFRQVSLGLYRVRFYSWFGLDRFHLIYTGFGFIHGSV